MYTSWGKEGVGTSDGTIAMCLGSSGGHHVGAWVPHQRWGTSVNIHTCGGETRSSSLFGLHEGRQLLWVWSSWGRQMESQHREEKWTWGPTPNSETISKWQLLAKEELVFSNKYISPPTHISHTSGQIPRPAVDGQHKTNSMVLTEISFLSHNALVETYSF